MSIDTITFEKRFKIPPVSKSLNVGIMLLTNPKIQINLLLNLAIIKLSKYFPFP